MKIIQLTEVVKPINNSVKSFNGERLYIATKSLKGNSIELKFSEQVDYENKPSRANQEVEVGDIIFAKMQGTRKTLLISEAQKNYIFSSGFFVLRTSEEILSEYLFHFLNSSFFLDQKDKNCTGATQKALTLEGLKKIFIPLPSLQIQKEIVNKLDKLSHLIELRKESIKKTEDLTKSIFIEMFGDISINSKGFQIMKFGDILEINAKMVDPKKNEYKGMRCIGGANIESETGNLIKEQTAEEQSAISNKFLVTKNDILFSKIRPKLKKVAFPQIECLCSADIYPFSLNMELITHSYILVYLLSDLFTAIVSEYAEKRAQIPKVNRKELDSILIPVPPITLQNKFAKIVQKNEENIKNQKESLVKLEELYSSEMQGSFSF